MRNCLVLAAAVAMFVNERRLLPVFAPAPTATLLDRAPAVIASVLQRHGAADAVVAAELAAMSEVRLAPTNDRSVLGVMNGFADDGERCFRTGVNDLEEQSMWVSQLIVGPLMKRTGSTDRSGASTN